MEPPPARWLWKLILNLIILNTRPAKSAEAYEEVWGHYGEGSPLLDISNRQLTDIEEKVRGHFSGRVEFALGMRYGNPSIADALKSLQERNVQRLIVLPLYPQYAGATTASTFDAVTAELQTWRWIPEMRFVRNYHKHPGYIKALANSIREHQEKHGKPDLLVMSYHGIPKRYFDNGDPYPCECRATSRLVAEELGIGPDDYMVTFQSLFGKEEWVKPYTERYFERPAGQRRQTPASHLPGLLRRLFGNHRRNRPGKPRVFRRSRRRNLQLHPGAERPRRSHQRVNGSNFATDQRLAGKRRF